MSTDRRGAEDAGRAQGLAGEERRGEERRGAAAAGKRK
jgi:hypothetical protein